MQAQHWLISEHVFRFDCLQLCAEASLFYCRMWLVKKSQPINHWLINAICAACEAGTAKAHSRTNLTRPREADETMWKMIKKSSSKTNTNCALEKRRRGEFFGFGSEHTAQETPRLSISIERRHDTQKGKKKWWQRKEEKINKNDTKSLPRAILPLFSPGNLSLYL